MLTLPATQMAYITAMIGLMTGLTTPVAIVLESFPFLQKNPTAFDWAVRTANFVLLLLGIIGAEVLQHAFSWYNILAYIIIATGSVAVSGKAYQIITARLKSQLADVVALPLEPITAPAGPAPTLAPAPDGKNSPVTFNPAGVAPH